MDLVERILPPDTPSTTRGRAPPRPGLPARPRDHRLAGRDRPAASEDAAYLAVAADAASSPPGSSGRMWWERDRDASGRSTSSSSGRADGVGRPLPGALASRSCRTGSSRTSPARCSSRTSTPDGGPDRPDAGSCSSTRRGCGGVTARSMRRLPGPLPRDRRPGGARGARRRRGGAGGQRPDRRAAPHHPHPGHPSRRHRALPGARRRGERPAALGLPRGPDGRADDPVPRPSEPTWQYPFQSLLRAGARAGDGLGLERLDRRTRCSRWRSRSTGSIRRAPRRSGRPSCPTSGSTLDEALARSRSARPTSTTSTTTTGSLERRQAGRPRRARPRPVRPGRGRIGEARVVAHVRRGRAGLRGPGARRLTLSARRSAGPAGHDPAAARDGRPTARRPRPRPAGRASTG